MTPSTSGASVLFSVLTHVDDDKPVDVLAETIESVLEQSLEDWELLLLHDCPPDDPRRRTLTRYAERDSRIRLLQRSSDGDLAGAWNSAVAEALGSFLVLLDHGDLVAPSALERNAAVVAEADDVDYVYSDEERLVPGGRRFEAVRKPDWSPERLRAQPYTAHLSVLRTSLVGEVGGLRAGLDGAERHDLVLRVTERARRVVHLPEVLYRCRAVPGSVPAPGKQAPDGGRRAVQEQLDRLGLDATVEPGTAAGTFRVRRRLRPDVRVSVVIPTIGTSGLVWGRRRVLVVEAVRSMLEHTGHDDLEIVVVYDPPTPPSVLDELRELAGDRLLLVPFRRPFVHGEKMNLGVLHSTGQRIVLINDDVEVISSSWLEELVAPLDEPDVGMTGAKLYFSDSTLQHAGHAYADGTYFHPFYRAAGRDPRVELQISREASGVTAACSALRRETYFDVGGFTEQLPTHFNDVDLCYKVRRLGHRIVWLAHVELFHFESVSRGRDPVPETERRLVLRRWGLPGTDPYLPAVRPPVPRGAGTNQRDRARSVAP